MNAELGGAPGGAKPERAAIGAFDCGTAASNAVATAARTSTREGVGVVVTTASADSVSQSGLAVPYTIEVGGAGAAMCSAPW
jgi:hypothetical protein